MAYRGRQESPAGRSGGGYIPPPSYPPTNHLPQPLPHPQYYQPPPLPPPQPYGNYGYGPPTATVYPPIEHEAHTRRQSEASPAFFRREGYHRGGLGAGNMDGRPGLGHRPDQHPYRAGGEIADPRMDGYIVHGGRERDDRNQWAGSVPQPGRESAYHRLPHLQRQMSQQDDHGRRPSGGVDPSASTQGRETRADDILVAIKGEAAPSPGPSEPTAKRRKYSGPETKKAPRRSQVPAHAEGMLKSAEEREEGAAVGEGPIERVVEGEGDPADQEEEEKMDHRKRKRNRTIRSCVPCHNHKRKCDRRRPCGRCTALGLTGTCVYEVDEARDSNDPDVHEHDRLRSRIAELEQVVRELRQRNHHQDSHSHHAARRSITELRPAATNSAVPPQEEEREAEDEGSAEVDESKKRRVMVDRLARFKIDEAAMAAVADAAASSHHAIHDDAGPPGLSVSITAADGEGEMQCGGEGSGQTDRLEGTRIEATTAGVGAGGREQCEAGKEGGGGAEDGGEAGKKKDYRAEPYTTYLLPGEEMVYDKIGRRTFLGAPAGRSMIRRLREITTKQKTNDTDEDLLTVPEEVGLIGIFPDLRKTFPFTTIWSHENFSGEIIGLLPTKEQSELLLRSWKDEVATMFCAWHVPTLELEYSKFFSMKNEEKMNVPLSCLSLYLMICSLGCVMRASKAEIFGPKSNTKDLTSSRLQSELYLSGAYQALRLCSFMSSPTLYTIQAQILINVYLLNAERAADAWAQTGSLVRQCIAMGLHVDPAALDPKLSMRDAEVRRRVWWTVASLDALLCVSFGRPSVINFYKTNLPQDRTDDNLSDAPGSSSLLLPPSNVLNNETTESTFHSAFYQLTIPSYELLDRIFHVDRKYSRSAIYGWFSPSPDSLAHSLSEEENQHTYEDALRLAADVFQWYSHIPRGMRLEVGEDSSEELVRTRSTQRINQVLALCMKAFMIVMALHRPYLRADPSAYPESTDICWRAAHTILYAYRIGAEAKATVVSLWWSLTFKAFHAAAVLAFLAIRQPGTEMAAKCLEDLRSANAAVEVRDPACSTAHPVQSDLISGLARLEKLVSAATNQQRASSASVSPSTGESSTGGSTNGVPLRASRTDPSRLSIHWTPNSTTGNAGSEPPLGSAGGGPFSPNTPLSQIRGFPEPISPGLGGSGIAGMISPGGFGIGGGHGHGGAGVGGAMGMGMGMGLGSGMPSMAPLPGAAIASAMSEGQYGDGFSGESMALPQFWASMFGIKLDGESQDVCLP